MSDTTGPSNTADNDESVHLARNGKPINSDDMYAVTSTGEPEFSPRDFVFLRTGHLWSAYWFPEAAGQLRLTRADETEYQWVTDSAVGLLGVCVHAVRGRFRIVEKAEFLAAAREIAVVQLPEGFTVQIVPPERVFGTQAEHNAALGQPPVAVDAQTSLAELAATISPVKGNCPNDPPADYPAVALRRFDAGHGHDCGWDIWIGER